MEILLQRIKHNDEATIGKLFIDGNLYCHTLEDEPREVKIKGETRIPAGKYEIKKRKALSGLTKKYRQKFSWFDYHLQLQNVPNFNYVYIHIGNYDRDTDGCILLGNWDGGSWAVWNSTSTFKKFYGDVSRALRLKEKITIEIIDE